MSEPSISFRLQAVDARGLCGQRRHDLRIGKQPSYVDPKRANRNRQLFRVEGFERLAVPKSRSVEKRAQAQAADTQRAASFARTSRDAIEARAKRKTTVRKYWRTAILTFSHAAQARLAETGALPHEEAQRMFEDFAARHDVRLLSVDFHGDESAPHYHASFEGVNALGYALRLDREQLSAEQDLAAAHFAGRGLTRGRKRKDREEAGEDPSKWIHRTVKEVHVQLPMERDALVKERDALQQQVEEARDKAATNEARAAKARTDLDTCKGDADKVRKRMETYEARAAKARAEVQALEADLDRQRTIWTAEQKQAFETAEAVRDTLEGIQSKVASARADADREAERRREEMLETAREAEETAVREAEALRADLTEVSAEAENARQEAESLREEVQDLIAQKSALEAVMEHLRPAAEAVKVWSRRMLDQQFLRRTPYERSVAANDKLRLTQIDRYNGKCDDVEVEVARRESRQCLAEAWPIIRIERLDVARETVWGRDMRTGEERIARLCDPDEYVTAFLQNDYREPTQAGRLHVAREKLERARASLAKLEVGTIASAIGYTRSRVKDGIHFIRNFVACDPPRPDPSIQYLGAAEPFLTFGRDEGAAVIEALQQKPAPPSPPEPGGPSGPGF